MKSDLLPSNPQRNENFLGDLKGNIVGVYPVKCVSVQFFPIAFIDFAKCVIASALKKRAQVFITMVYQPFDRLSRFPTNLFVISGRA